MARLVALPRARRIRILLSPSGDIIYYFCERGEEVRWNAKWYASVRSPVIVSGDNLQAEDRMKLAESFVFFPSRKFRWNYFNVTSVNPACLPVKLSVIPGVGGARLFFSFRLDGVESDFR